MNSIRSSFFVLSRRACTKSQLSSVCLVGRPSPLAGLAPTSAQTWNKKERTIFARQFQTSITQWKPSIAEAKAMPKDYSSMSNDCVLLMATHGDQNAKEERLRREIMAVDEVDYEKASETFLKIAQYNRIGSFRRTLPYKLGILGGISGAFVSIPLVFNLKTALWFNREYVTTDVPEPRDLETWLEVGAWTWNWMEPVLGHISFFLLALAFARAQMLNLGVAPYTNFVRNRRANSVADKFSQYDRKIVTDYSLHSPW